MSGVSCWANGDWRGLEALLADARIRLDERARLIEEQEARIREDYDTIRSLAAVEKERDEARREAEGLREALTEARDEVLRLRRERDEALAKLNSMDSIDLLERAERAEREAEGLQAALRELVVASDEAYRALWSRFYSVHRPASESPPDVVERCREGERKFNEALVAARAALAGLGEGTDGK